MKPLLACLGLIVLPATAMGQAGTLGSPFPPPSPNAALHYQRAMLFEANLSEDQQALLGQPIWEFDATAEKGRLIEVLHDGRHAIQATSEGSRLTDCDFGIDFRTRGSATRLPHLNPSLRLARLLALRAYYSQRQGEWEQSAVLYFDGLRFGKHLTHQNTLLEALTGMKIIRENLYLLANWAAECPSEILVGSAFVQLEALVPSLIDPAGLVTRESSILGLELASIYDSYPNGDWGTKMLNAFGVAPASSDRDAVQQQAKREAIAQGIPEAAFESDATFRSYLRQLDALTTRFAEASAACMTLPAEGRLERGDRLYEKYSMLLTGFGDAVLFDPREVGAVLSSFEAEVCAARVALAVCASKEKQTFPSSLNSVAVAFGGTIPASPYDGSSVEYMLNDDEQGFSILINEATFAGTTLPAVDFSSAPPEKPSLAVAN